MGFDLTTFLFELVNFGLLLWILQRVVYRPLRAGIERRREQLGQARERAAAEQRAAESARGEAESRLAEIDKLREGILSDALEQAAKERSRILEEARQDAAAERQRVERTLERERGEALAWVREAAVDNAAEITGRLLLDLLPESADRVLLDALVAALPDHAATIDEELRAVAEGEQPTAELSATRPVPDDALRALEDALRARGADCRLVVREDPSLVAGVVLRIGSRVLDASVAGHLGVVRERALALAKELPHDD